MRAKYKIKLVQKIELVLRKCFRGNAFGIDNFTKIKELASVTETYSKESQDICREKSC